MTGYIVTIIRNQVPQKLDVTELTDQELDEYFAFKSRIPEELWASWVKHFVRWIRDNAPKPASSREDPIVTALRAQERGPEPNPENQP